MKKVLGIIGSPRRQGNTHILVSKILEGAEAAGAQTQTIFLNDITIRECDGCHACWKGKPCSKRDDMNDLYSVIAENDVIVFGTPVYWYGPTALMKAFIDRWVYFNCPQNRPKIRNKSAILAVPFEEDNPATADATVAMFEKSFEYLEMRLAGQAIVPGVGEKGDILAKVDKLNEGFELGRKIASEL